MRSKQNMAPNNRYRCVKDKKAGKRAKKSEKTFAYKKICLPLHPLNANLQHLTLRKTLKGEYQSGQMGQTVNLLVYTFGGSNPSSPTA